MRSPKDAAMFFPGLDADENDQQAESSGYVTDDQI